MTDTETRHTRYRANLWGECGEKPYSAGRPRCRECHEEYESGLKTPVPQGPSEKNTGAISGKLGRLETPATAVTAPGDGRNLPKEIRQ